MTSAFTRPLRFMIAAALVCAAPVAGAPLAAPAYAQDAGSPEAQAAAEELFALLSQDMLDAALAQANDAFWPQIEQELNRIPDMTDEIKAEVRAAMEVGQSKFIATVMKAAPGVYAKYFTADELGEILAFYKTPVGVKMLEKFPELNQEITNLIVSHIGDIQQGVESAVKGVLEKHGLSTNN